MGNYSKKGDFKPGNKASVGHGRPKVPKELKKLRKVTRSEVEKILHDCSRLSIDELQEKLKDKSISALDMLITRVFSVGIQKGDNQKLAFLLDRLIGPITIKTETEVKGSLYKQVLDAINGQDLAAQQSLQDKE